MPNKSKPGDEGLLYSSPEKVIGAPPDNQPSTGLGADKGVTGGPTIKKPSGK